MLTFGFWTRRRGNISRWIASRETVQGHPPTPAPLHIVERLGHERLQGGVFLDRDLVAASPL
jgi:hypothetical protein